MTPQNKQLKGYKSERCMNCSHHTKFSNSKIMCGLDNKIRWKDDTCDSFKFSEECYEQSIQQPEAIARDKTIIEIWKEWCEKDISWTDAALGAMRDFASQQTSAKDKEIAELKQRISELEKLI